MDDDLCPVCNENPASDPHPCPYALELEGDDRECTCCANCEYNCLQCI